MSDKFDELEKAKMEIDKQNIPGVSTKIITKKKVSKSDLEKIRKAREQLKDTRSGGR